MQGCFADDAHKAKELFKQHIEEVMQVRCSCHSHRTASVRLTVPLASATAVAESAKCSTWVFEWCL
jgi:hypothetical protein